MISFLLAISAFFAVSCHNLPLPQELQSYAIYHRKAHQLQSWSCGYNALFNACNLEQCLGIKNKFSDFKIFNHYCMSYIKKHQKNPEDGISNVTIDEFAHHFGLRKSLYLMLDNNQVVPLLIKPITLTVLKDTAEDTVEHMLTKKRKQKELASIKKIKSELERNNDHVTHFICHVTAKNEDHCILISLIQRKKTRALFIFDNLNMAIKSTSTIKKYIDYLMKEFTISKHYDFHQIGIKLPSQWPTTPKLPKGYYYRYE